MPLIFLRPYLATVISDLFNKDTDPYFDNVALLMHMDGSQGATTFTDVKGATISKVGTPTITTTVSKINGSSGKFNGSTDYVVTPVSTKYGLSTNDFTIEGWFNAADSGRVAQALLDFRSNGAGSGQTRPTIFIQRNTIFFIVANNVVAQQSISNNIWYHFAWSRVAGRSYFFVNGARITSVADTNNYGASNDIVIGQTGDSRAAGYFFNGYIDEFRVTNGVGRYTTAFAPSSLPYPDNGTGTEYDPFFGSVSLLMHMDGANGSTTFTDVKGAVVAKNGTPVLSTSQFKIGTASLALNGTTDYVSVPASTNYGLGTGDFTIECWFRSTNVGKSTQGIIDTRAAGQGSSQLKPGILCGSGNLAFQVGGVSVATTPIVNNTWYHIAWSRKNGKSMFFVNGALLSTTYADTNNYGTSNDIIIGQVGDTRGFDGWLPGNIDEVRITKGVGRYTIDFTPMSAPYPNYATSPDT